MFNHSLTNPPPTPCEWTGCNEDWNEEISPITGDTNGCSFLVYYRWRICPDNIYQLEMKSIELISGGNCGTTSSSAIFHQAIVTLLASSAGIFGLGQGDFDVTLKIPACVQRVYDFTNGNCSSQCCEKTYSMEYYNGEMKVVTQTANPVPVTCSGIGGQTCNYFCNEMEIPEDETLIPFHYENLYQTCGPIWCSGGSLNSNLRQLSVNITAYSMIIWYYFVECDRNQKPKKFIQVVRIELIRPMGNWSQYEYMKEAYKRVLYEEGNKDLNVWYRMLVKTCWKKTIKIINNIPRIIQFDNCQNPFYCCYRDLKFGLSDDKPGKLEVKEQDSLHTSTINSCNEQGCEYLGGQHNYCDIVSEFDIDFDIPRISIDKDNNDYSEIYSYNSNQVIDKIIFNIPSITNDIIILEIYDILGNKFKSSESKNLNNKAEFDLSKLNNGIYFYTINIQNKIITGKFIIFKN